MSFNRKCNQFYTQAFPSPSAAPAHQKISDQMYPISFSPCLGFPSLRPARSPYIGTVDFLVPARIQNSRFLRRPARGPRPSPDFSFSTPDFLRVHQSRFYYILRTYQVVFPSPSYFLPVRRTPCASNSQAAASLPCHTYGMYDTPVRTCKSFGAI